MSQASDYVFNSFLAAKDVTGLPTEENLSRIASSICVPSRRRLGWVSNYSMWRHIETITYASKTTLIYPPMMNYLDPKGNLRRAYISQYRAGRL